jgi:aspartate racemase
VRAGPLGVVGGLGPIASAEFVRTIYEHSLGRAEQTMPAIVMLSDPDVPDRTDALANGGAAALLDRLGRSMHQLIALHCSHAVVCCVTMHAVVPQLPAALRERIVSLVDVAIERIRAAGESQMLFCSNGTRAMRVFERHARWAEVARLVVLPEAADQERIHAFIQAIKRTGDAEPFVHLAGALLETYGVRSLVVGCTEFHLLSKAARRRAVAWRTCDPLDEIARQWAAATMPGTVEAR